MTVLCYSVLSDLPPARQIVRTQRKEYSVNRLTRAFDYLVSSCVRFKIALTFRSAAYPLNLLSTQGSNVSRLPSLLSATKALL